MRDSIPVMVKFYSGKIVKEYSVTYYRSKQGFWAEILQLPGCYSQGETLEEAMQNVYEAAECHESAWNSLLPSPDQALPAADVVGKWRLPRFDAEHFIEVLKFAQFDGRHLELESNGDKHSTFWSPRTERFVTVPVGKWDIAAPVLRRVLNEVGISREYLHEIRLDVKGF
jgi:predicted RNase H-like HicB family nuclease